MLISVIIPCYNAERTIRTCMESLMRQTIGFYNLQVILVDDASTDGTLEMLYVYEKHFPDNVTVIHYDVNSRQGYARNLAIQYAVAPYVTFVDADDFLALNALELLYGRQQGQDFDFVMGLCYRVIGGRPCEIPGDNRILERLMGGGIERRFEIETAEERRLFLRTELPLHGAWGILYSKKFIIENEIHFAEGLFYEDLLWQGLMLLYARRVCAVSDRIYFYVNWDGQSSILKTESESHFDRLSVMLLYLEETRQRGLYEQYRPEIEMHFLQLYYLNTVPFFTMRFAKAPAGQLEEMRKTVRREIPHYADNPYVTQCSELEKLLLKLLEEDELTQEMWDVVWPAIRETLDGAS